MSRIGWTRRLVAAGLAISQAFSVAHAQSRPGGVDRPPVREVLSQPGAAVTEAQDLYYGKVLFYFFQKRYFSSVTELLYAKEKERLKFHADEAELLLAGLYVSYGMYNEAEAIFQRMVDKLASSSLKNRAWFHLGEIFYQRARYEQARRALENVSGKLPPELTERRILLLASVYLAEQNYTAAVDTLKGLNSKSVWARYGVFNMGVALLKLNQVDQGSKLLESIGRLETTSKEEEALRDKANIALGFGALKRSNSAAAELFFRRVRLEGPYSNQALFGMGQALFDLRRPEDALKFWLELQGRSRRGAAVIEAHVAVPQAYFQMKAYQQALDGFNNVMTMIDEETVEIDAAITEITNTNLLEQMLNDDPVVDEIEAIWRPQALPDPLRRHYITQLLASHEFNEALKSYRDLRFFHGHLLHWQDNMASYDEMLNVRRTAFERRLPQVIKAIQQQADIDAKERYQKMLEELDDIELNDQPIRLATPEEQAFLVRLKSVEQRIGRLDGQMPDFRLQAFRENQRFLSGVVHWRIASNFKPRAYVVRQHLKTLNRQIERAEQRRESLAYVKDRAPEEFAAFGQRTTNLRERIRKLIADITQAQNDQAGAIHALAISRLQQQRKRLEAYKTQAQFGAAQVYDIAISSDANKNQKKP